MTGVGNQNKRTRVLEDVSNRDSGLSMDFHRELAGIHHGGTGADHH